jgi:hypothetical protein
MGGMGGMVGAFALAQRFDPCNYLIVARAMCRSAGVARHVHDERAPGDFPGRLARPHGANRDALLVQGESQPLARQLLAKGVQQPSEQARRTTSQILSASEELGARANHFQA